MAKDVPRTLPFRHVPRHIWLQRACVATVMAVALLNWLGWATGIGLLTDLYPGWVAMTPWTALALFLLAAATSAQTESSPTVNRRGRVMAGAAGLLAALVLGEYVTGRPWGFDLWLFHSAVLQSYVANPGRPAPATAIAIEALAVAILQLRREHRYAELFSQILLAIAVFPALASVAGYAAGATGIFVFDTTTGMALVTAMCALLIAVAIVAVRPDRRPMTLFTARPDRVSAMRLLLVFLLFPLLLLLGEQMLHTMGESDRAAVVLSDLFAALVVGTSVFSVSSDQQRRLRLEAELTAELRASEHRYRLLAENGSDVILTGPPDGRIDWVSDSVTRTLGWQPQYLVGKNGLEFIHPDDRPATELRLLRVASGHPQRFEARWLRADGGTLWMSGLMGPQLDSAGQIVGRITNWRDVSAEHLAREELAAERELLAVNMQALLDPLALLKALRDLQGRVVDFEYLNVNDAACAYFGLSREQLIGLRLVHLRPAVNQTGLLDLYAAAVDTGAPLAIDDFLLGEEGGTMRYLDIRGRRVSGDRLSVTWRDVTERRESAASLAASEAHFRLLAENTADVVFRLLDGVVTWISPSVQDALGDSVESWVGRDVTTTIHPDDLAVYMDAVTHVRQGETILRRVRLLDHEGVFHWIEVHAKQYLDPEGVVEGAICSMRVVDAEVAAEQALDRMARFDDLTSLMNRGEALRRLASANSTLRKPGQHTAVLFCDVDRFKQVNDTLGHAAGDEVLRVLAQRIRDCVRTSDLVARMGGDEIMVVLLGLNDPEAAVRIAEKIRASSAEPINTAEGIVHTSMSIGVTSMADGENPDALIARADSAMYEAKDIGRNRVIRVG